MLMLKISAGVGCLTAIGFGAPTPFVATHLLREGKLPMFMNLFPAYGGGVFERWPPPAFVTMLGLFASLSALEVFGAWLLWNGQRVGALITLGLLPIEIFFWIGFALPIPPVNAVLRIALLVLGWSALR